MITTPSARPTAVHAQIASRIAAYVPSIHPVARTSVICYFRENDSERVEQQQTTKTSTKLNPEQLEEVYHKEAGNVSPRMAELRADLGSAATDLSQYQAFDGPIPETVNGRLAMLGVLSGLCEEAFTGSGLLEQCAAHPLRILIVGLLIGFASYAPVVRGYTRKEYYANRFAGLPWIPMAENWNGRLAMIGFTGMIFSEAVLGTNTLQAWGLQPLHLGL